MDNIFIKGTRWLFAGILMAVLFGLIVTATFATSVSLQFTREENLKRVIEGSGIYEQAVPLAVEGMLGHIEETASDSGEDISTDEILGNFIDKDELEEKLTAVFPPEWIQVQTEQAIDEFYAYIREEKEDIQIRVDFSGREEAIQGALASVFKDRLYALEDCGYSTREGIDEFDLLNAECLPDNIDREEAAQVIDSEFQKLPFLQEQSFSLDGFSQGAENDPVRRMFFFVKTVPLLLWALILALTALLFGLIPGKKPKSIAQTVLWGGVGISLVLAALGARLNFENIFIRMQARVDVDISPEIAAFIKQAILVVYNSLIFWVLIFACIYILVAVLFILLVRSDKYLSYYKYMKKFFIALLAVSVVAVLLLFVNAKQKGVFEGKEQRTAPQYLNVKKGVGFISKGNFIEDLKTANEVGLVFLNAAAEGGQPPEVIRTGFESGYLDFPVPNMAGSAENPELLKQAYLELVRKHDPVFIGIGNELEHMEDTAEFVKIYPEIYEAVKEECSACIAYPVFQYERFDPALARQLPLDLLVFTSYPFIKYGSIHSIPDSYYSVAQATAEELGVDVAFTEIGWTTLPAYKSGDEDVQSAFYRRFQELTESINIQFVGWGLLYGAPEAGPEWADMGLLDSQGNKKNIFYEFSE